MSLGSTPSQTVGPYLSLGLPWPDGPTVVPEGTPGAVWIRGTVLDGAGQPVPDALVETWQADPDGRFDHPDDPRGRVPGFRGFGRCPTSPDGDYGILTLPPGPVPAPGGGTQAPHIDVSVLGRGLLHRVVTRIYFPDNAEANAADPVLRAVPAERRDTLVAARTADGYRFDVRLQGERETVFFDV
ncbi:protocatechuate 3,4-dioxygenase alpha subunit [Amycolatopsis arida]|uniref:Protocatechuate 3,4-dioxygenase alpha subunit n=1 Tax=Amycolatopsis arida TaxID=587909 RepID=A0A1I5SPJ1_9PSEU|nr:protocatechuate 3,4-dioxygenase subunit alpha [Amycolatopsis arida]TDX96398.1 protocatechuate 3,4-dioxygenase alpha subunit [Amycolatopsis arida]SFP72673.1 protocatechuate 3,4-dioxygenase alpha subunit [Amycolatopsis arida]